MTESTRGRGGAERTDVIDDSWRFYGEHAEQARQHETLRASVTSTLSAVAAAIVGLAGVGGIERGDVLTGATVVLVGLLGAALSVKHYERNRFHTTVMRVTRDEISALRAGRAQPSRPTSELRGLAETEHARDFSLFERRRHAVVSRSLWVPIRLHLLWMALPLLIALVGAVIIVLALLA
jgi:hypothetical protein